MVRMLGFSEEEKQRIGLAQQVAGKGVVRGVLGLPGRLVGGIMGGSSHETPSGAPSDNQVTFSSCSNAFRFYLTRHLVVGCSLLWQWLLTQCTIILMRCIKNDTISSSIFSVFQQDKKLNLLHPQY